MLVQNVVMYLLETVAEPVGLRSTCSERRKEGGGGGGGGGGGSGGGGGGGSSTCALSCTCVYSRPMGPQYDDLSTAMRSLSVLRKTLTDFPFGLGNLCYRGPLAMIPVWFR